MDKLIFLNIGWMSKYEGPRGDQISGGGGYVALHGWGHEMLNFKPYDGKMYGTAPVPQGIIRLERLGAAKGAESVDGVLVVWVAKSRIVGWYKNATVYRHPQPPPRNSGRSYRGDPIRYYVTAARSNCRLLDRDARLLPVPRAQQRKHAMGRYTWYAEGGSNSVFRAKVFKYVAANGEISVLGSKKREKPGGKPHQPDPYKRSRVWKEATRVVKQHFESLGYKVDNVETDNLGWDLNAEHRQSRVRLNLEVKGLSGREISVELTPNEYKMMRKYKHTYRICVATSCLDKAQSALAIFAYNDVSRQWLDGADRPLRVNEVKAARLRLLSPSGS